MNNVLDFGARGDGIAKDTAPVQAALDAGGIVFFLRGLICAALCICARTAGWNFPPGRFCWRARTGRITMPMISARRTGSPDRRKFREPISSSHWRRRMSRSAAVDGSTAAAKPFTATGRRGTVISTSLPGVRGRCCISVNPATSTWKMSSFTTLPTGPVFCTGARMFS